MNELISVIVPLYKTQEHVEACLDSLKAQTYTNFEAICVDDVSPDNTLRVAQAAAADDSRFIFVQRAENGGLSAARNTGIAHAQGTYLMFLDSDDLLVPHALETLLSFATEHNLDLLDYNAQALYETEQLHETHSEDYFQDRQDIEGVHTGAELFSMYQEHIYACPAWLHFIKLSLLENAQLSFYEGILHEDELYSPLLHAAAKRAAYLNEALYLHRIHSNTIMTTPRGIRNVAGLLVVTRELEDFLSKHASEYSTAFVEAFAKRICEMETIMAFDLQQCSADEIAELAASLSSADYARLATRGLQRMYELQRNTEHAAHLQQELDEVYASKTWRLGDTLARLPRLAVRVARK